jgi:hypothetical protein
MVLGNPHSVKARGLSDNRSRHRGVQHGGVVLAGKLRSKQEHLKAPELPPRFERVLADVDANDREYLLSHSNRKRFVDDKALPARKSAPVHLPITLCAAARASRRWTRFGPGVGDRRSGPDSAWPG